MNSVISVENLNKQYDLGVIGTGTLSRDLNRWWARVRKQPDPYTRIGQQDAFAHIGETILALDDVSFSVQQGEVLGIIGRNGAGKSTLLKILSRVTAPTSGVVKVKGRIGSLLEVGTGFHPELTGRENVYLNGAILGMKKTEVARKFEEIVAFSGVEKFIDTPVKRYSSGMYVRLAFAVAAHLESEILIVDEVLAVGDAEFQKKCLGKMGDVASEEGRTVLFVSHNMASIQSLCPRSILLQSGRIFSNGQSVEIVATYLEKTSLGGKSHTAKFQNLDSRSTWLEEVSILINGKPGYIMSYGDELYLDCKISSVDGIKKPSLGMVISSLRGETVLNFNNLYLPFPNNLKALHSMTIGCRLGAVPLMEGHYLISIWLGDERFSRHEYFENALAFEVVSKDYWGQGTLPTKNISSLWWPTEFRINEDY